MTIPVSWTSAPLGEIAELALGKMLDRTKRVKGQMRPYLRNVNVRWGGFELSSLLEMPFQEYEHARYSVRDGDVLICEGGEPGRAAVWDQGREIMFQKALHRVRPKVCLDPRWLVLHLRNDALQGTLESFFSGTTIKHFTGVALSRYPILLPPIAEQHRIIAALERLAQSCGRLRRSLEDVAPLVAQIRQSVLASAFRGDLTADWREQNPGIEPAPELLKQIGAERRRIWEQAELERMRARGKAPADDRWKARYVEPEPVDDSALPDLPEAWAWASVNQISCKIDYGTSAKLRDSGEVAVLRMGNVENGKLHLGDLRYLSRKHKEFPGLLLAPGDLLFNRTNSLELVGKSAVYEERPNCCSFASYLIRVRLINVIAALLSHYINSPGGRAWAQSVAHQQVGQANINGTKLRNLPVPVPPQAEQQEILRRIERCLEVVAAVKSQVSEVEADLAAFDRAILAKAFRGELVPHEPSDEAAALLLDRIRTERRAAEREREERGSTSRARRGRSSSRPRRSRKVAEG